MARLFMKITEPQQKPFYFVGVRSVPTNKFMSRFRPAVFEITHSQGHEKVNNVFIKITEP